MAPSSPSVRPTLSAFDDLESDQANFFRQHLDAHPHLDTEQAIAALSLSRHNPIPTPPHLPPIEERSLTRRRRRPVPSHHLSAGRAFPPVYHDEDGLTFGRGRLKVEGEASPQKGPEESIVVGDLDATIRAMSPHELAEAKEEIEALLSPNSIQFLKQRGRNAHTRPSIVDDPRRHAYPQGHLSNEENHAQTLVAGPSASYPRLDPDECEAERPSSPVANPSRQATQHPQVREAEKRWWMTDATELVAEQAEVDDMVADAVRQLGPLGERRFDLEGHVLSPHDIQSLPVHMGLHHHGSAPASAGYTLADLLLLTRSTVVTQRVVALRIVAALLLRYRDEVMDPLVTSGGLALIFAEFPAHLSFESALTFQMAYVPAVEAVVTAYWCLSDEELVPDLYFASRFYTGSLTENVQPCFEILANSGCPAVLINIAKTNVSRRGGDALACRSLAMLRAIVKSSVAAAKAILSSGTIAKALEQLACGSDPLHTATVLLACDTLAQAIVNIGWEGAEILQTLEKNVFGDEFLRKVSVHLAWFLRDMPDKPQTCQYHAALGAIRLFRATLAFERGTVVFTTSAQAACRLARDPKTSVEAFLALEAYAHALYTIISRRAEVEKEAGRDETDENMNGFAADQLSELLPVAISAAKMFTSLRSSEREVVLRKAAAGHFAATVLSTTKLPLDVTMTALLLNECSETSQKIRSKSFGTEKNLKELQALGSVSHAGARILSRVNLEPSFAKREVLCLIHGVHSEFRVLSNRSLGWNPWRPIANASVEWVCSLAKVDYCKEIVGLAVNLLPMLVDFQVVLDLLSRCVLKAQILTQMSKRITVEDARNCARDLLPVTLTGIQTLFNDEKQTVPVTERGKLDDSHLITLPRLMRMWIAHTEVVCSVLNLSWALFDGELLEPVKLFQCLLLAPYEMHECRERLFSAMLVFASAAVKKGQSLLNPAGTKMSSTSTTVNPKSVDAVLSIAEYLTHRGPQATSLNSPDSLSSVAITIMCKKDADASLRLSLWQKTVVECGGGMLYKGALYLPFSHARSIDTTIDEDDVMLAAYCGALVDGLLIGERCPTVLGLIIVSRLECRLKRAQDLQVLESLEKSLRDQTQTAAYESIQNLLSMNSAEQITTPALAAWLRKQVLHRYQNKP